MGGEDATPPTVELPPWVDDMCATLATAGTEHLRRLGFTGTVVVNVEWTEDPNHGYFCIGSKIPDGATDLLAQSLRHSASEIEDR